jgi:YedE family putative selenium metabolism protein
LSKLWSSRTWIIYAGAIFGVIAALMTKLGNPLNMGVCVACFIRDITGALGLQRAETVQYLRPEIPAFVLGAFGASLIFKEFRPRGGSAPIIRFFLGVFLIIGALVFLGCSTRMILRLAGGDLNALVGLGGLVGGVLVGIVFLKKGFNLGRSVKMSAISGWIMPVLMLGVLALVFLQPGFIFQSQKGPGSQFAPVGLSLAAGLLIGVMVQRTRMCFVGAWRDVFLVKDFHLLSGVAAFFVGALITNYALGFFDVGTYHWGFTGEPIAHSDFVWNFLGMGLFGLAATMLGGCPLRNLVLSGEGDTDAGVTVLGFFAGGAFAHNFLLASSANGVSAAGPIAVVIGLVFCAVVGFLMMERSK